MGMPLAPRDRREVLLSGLDLATTTGAEIGPLHSPLVERQRFDVLYVDHCDTHALRQRWATDPAVDVTRLHVDAVWGERSLSAALLAAFAARARARPSPALDYVLASHVIEHVPDLVTWLHEVGDVLRRDGHGSQGG